MQTETHCTVGRAFTVRFPVSECSAYDDKRMPSRYDMEQIAWMVQSKNRGPVGFAANGSMEVEIVSPAERFGNYPQQPAMPTQRDSSPDKEKG